VQVKVYILEGFNFKQLDLFSLSDPYLVVKTNKSEFNERKEYQMDTATPQFWKCYTFQERFPGANVLSIESYDYDDFFGDDLIGVTKIDFDDRWYSKEWRACIDKPIETRDLYIQSSSVSQGRIRLWIDIFNLDSKKSEKPDIVITPEPLKEFEARFIIWKTTKIEMMDFEGTSDVYIKSFVDPDHEYRTDTHWRNQDGDASFNWRNKILLKSKQPDYKI
jgi:Ca2+-dependent lipid-binding protein